MGMPAMTDAELAILSIVAEGPIYGYDIQTIITQRGLRDWTNIGVSSMYYVLEKLERQGLIESKGVQHVEGPARRQYRITSAGFGVLQTAVADLVSTPREHFGGFELGLANLHVLRPAQIRTAFIAYRQELISRLTQARERWQHLKQSKAPFNVDAMFGHHVAMLEAELEWVKAFIEQWEAQAPPDEIPSPEPFDIPRMKQVVLPHDPDSPHRVPTQPIVGPRARPNTEVDTDLPELPSHKETALSKKTPLDLPQSPDTGQDESSSPTPDDVDQWGEDDSQVDGADQADEP
jgi:DNA-binding PadR family transcriptional regulator